MPKKTVPRIFLESKKFITQAKSLIIMTSYGRDTLLRRAIQSVLNQSTDDYILIIIDDNSPQINKKTQPIIKKFDNKSNHIIYFRTETTKSERMQKSTFCRNINLMIKFALRNLKIKYVCYLPCDDMFYDYRVETTATYLDNNRHANACFNPMHLEFPNRNPSKIVIPIEPYRNRMISKPISLLDHSAVTHRVSLFNSIEYPFWPESKHREHISPDGEFFTKLVEVGGPIFPLRGAPQGLKLRHKASIQGKAGMI